MTPVIIGRPPEEDGLTFPEMMSVLKERYGISAPKEITIAGIGMGTEKTLTEEVKQAITKSDCVIGAGRMLEMAKAMGKPCFNEISPDKIASVIDAHPEYTSFAVLMSGDTGFFSGTKKLIPILKEKGIEPRVLPGLSSMSYLASRVGESYDDACTVSLHGRDRNIVQDVKTRGKVLCLVGGNDGVSSLIDRLISGGLGDVTVHVGERLGYDDEKITSGAASELRDKEFDSLSAVMIVNPDSRKLTCGFPDSAFLRGGDSEGVVPMTKSEIRAVVISKLRIGEDSVCWDIGAGTGSVSIEMALSAPSGIVYAVEKKEKALELLGSNVLTFGTSNVKIVPGYAPEALTELPAPTHVFVGGSSGNMDEILRVIFEKNPDARVIASAVSLETVGELANLVKKYDFGEREVVCLNVSRGREIGSYNLMTAQNPIYLFTMQYPASSENSGEEAK